MINLFGINLAGGAGGGGKSKLPIIPVQTLPDPANAKLGAIYVVPSQGSSTDNIFDEYIAIDGKWEKFGSGKVDVITDYSELTGKPKINGKTLDGDLEIAVMTPEEREKLTALDLKVGEIEETLYPPQNSDTLVISRNKANIEEITETREVSYSSKESIEFDGSEITKKVVVTKPCLVFGSILVKNLEQVPGGMIPAPYATDYEINVGSTWYNSGTFKVTASGGEYEASVFEVTEDMLVGGSYEFEVGVRGTRYKTVPIKTVGQVYHCEFAIYYKSDSVLDNLSDIHDDMAEIKSEVEDIKISIFKQDSLIVEAGDQGKMANQRIGSNLANLETNDKSTLIAAINELVARIKVLEQGGGGGGVKASYDESDTAINFTSGAEYDEANEKVTLNGGTYDEQNKTINI